MDVKRQSNIRSKLLDFSIYLPNSTIKQRNFPLALFKIPSSPARNPMDDALSDDQHHISIFPDPRNLKTWLHHTSKVSSSIFEASVRYPSRPCRTHIRAHLPPHLRIHLQIHLRAHTQTPDAMLVAALSYTQTMRRDKLGVWTNKAFKKAQIDFFIRRKTRLEGKSD
jgi:hypothetical protein